MVMRLDRDLPAHTGRESRAQNGQDKEITAPKFWMMRTADNGSEPRRSTVLAVGLLFVFADAEQGLVKRRRFKLHTCL
jgi:hypothetical protein